MTTSRMCKHHESDMKQVQSKVGILSQCNRFLGHNKHSKLACQTYDEALIARETSAVALLLSTLYVYSKFVELNTSAPCLCAGKAKGYLLSFSSALKATACKVRAAPDHPTPLQLSQLMAKVKTVLTVI